MATRSKPAATVEVIEDTVEVVQAVETAPVAVVAAPAPAEVAPTRALTLLDQTSKSGIPNNTWTLWYGGYKFDCVEGVARPFPQEVFNYLKRAGNLIPPNF